jgi:hypothetical protein
MELEFAMLALAADAGEGGKLHIFGGGFDTMTVGSLPGAIPPFALVIKLRGTSNEVGQRHRLLLTLTTPSGERKELGSPEFATSPNQYAPERPSFSTIIAQVMLAAEQPGEYTFTVALDGQEIKRLPLHVRQEQAQ